MDTTSLLAGASRGRDRPGVVDAGDVEKFTT